MTSTARSSEDAPFYDVVVVGAGLAGVYAVYRLRNDGFSVRAYDSAAGVGGTWYWNAYPGAKCDVESVDYSYSFSDELQQEWVWKDRYPAQKDILEYINHVVDRFDLRRDIQLETWISGASYDEDSSTWAVELNGESHVRCRFLIMATGTLSAPLQPDFDGLDEFEGTIVKTQTWPHEDVALSGKRVAVVGTGSSGMQAIPVIAERAGHLTVFQRTANFSVPAHNRPLEPEELAKVKAMYPEYRRQQRSSPFGYADNIVPQDQSALDLDPEERRQELEERWAKGGAPNFMTAFGDVLTNEKSNEVVAEFVRDKIREKVEDPEIAEKLTPKDHPIATKRLVVDSHYFETFNRDNVELVDIRENPIQRLTRTGIETTADHYDFDVIVFALGYDFFGALMRMDIRGRGGQSLAEAWSAGPEAYLGLGVPRFPNLFTVTGPYSPSVLAVMIVAIEHDVEWIADAIGYCRDNGIDEIEALEDAQRDWVEECEEISGQTLFYSANSYYVGANVVDKPRRLPLYLGGMDQFANRCREVAEAGYKGFHLS